MNKINNTNEVQKIYDGPYEVSGIEIENNGQIFKGMLYFPPEEFNKPYPLILHFHEFPQLLPLQEIVKKYRYLLDLGFAFISINLRGYRYSEGEVSIASQVSDGLKLIEFAKKMAEKNFFILSDINVLAHDLGAYIALLVCSKSTIINKLLLLSPIVDLRKHVNSKEFENRLKYINKFLPGNIRGIEDPTKFIELTKKELSWKEFKLKNAIKNLKINSLKIILGEADKITPISELEFFKLIDQSNIILKTAIIDSMDHDPIEIKEMEQVNQEIIDFFKN
jgi:alpha/beta superfamily hydrolase